MLNQKIKSVICLFVMAAIMAALSGCGSSSYVVPGRGAAMKIFTTDMIDVPTDVPEEEAEDEIASDIEIIERKPTAQFPVNMVTARVQEPKYKSYTVRGYGKGKYTVVTVLDVEKEEDFERLGRLVGINQISRLSQLLLPEYMDSDKELREAAARLQADMVLIYTLDTTFLDKDTSAAFTVISLGTWPTIEVRVITTVSALVMDTRTGFIYGMADRMAEETQKTAALSSKNTCENLRLKTERQAFENFLDEFEIMWKRIVEEHR